MPPPASRCSPRRELRGESHKRGRSLENGLLFREKDDDLALFNEMQSKERENFLLQSTDELEDSFSRKLRYFSDIKLGISIPARGESSELLNADGEKNDYDWLLTPPDTPLFPSLDDEAPPVNLAQRGRPRNQPISISRSSTMEKSYKSSRGSASPQRSTPSPRSSNSVFLSSGRPSSAPHSSPTSSLRNGTPSRRPSPPPRKSLTPAPRSSTPTPRRISTGSSSTAVSSGARGVSPIKASRGNSSSPRIQAWQSNIPGFSSDAPPNLRTSLADRPASYVRGSSPASRHGKDSSSKFGRQSISPTASRSISSSYSNDQDRFSPHSKGSVASSGDDDVDSLRSVPLGSSEGVASRRAGAFPKSRALAFSKKTSRTLSSSSAPKRSFDSALRLVDHRKSPQNMFRPLLSSVPSTTFYVGNATSTHRTMKSRNSSVTTSSNASSDQGTSFVPDTEGSDQNHDEATSKIGNAASHEVRDEVFVFDKADVINEDVGQETFDESQSIRHVDFDAMDVPTTFEGLNVKAGFSEAVSSKDNICSKCGCRYCPVEPMEDAELCPDCSRKYGILSITIPVATSVYHNSTDILMNASEEFNPSRDSEPVVPLFESAEAMDAREAQHEKSVEQGQTFNHGKNESYLQENPPVGPVAEECEERHVDDLNSKVDASAVTGISVLLLNRSSSMKGNIVQGRTFTATSIPYENPSYARDGRNSLSISAGHGSASASSSADLSLSRQAEARAQRRLSTGSSFSGISNPAFQSLGFARSFEVNCDASISNVEYDDEEKPYAFQEQVLASNDTEIENGNQSFMSQTENALPSEASRHASHARLEENSAASFQTSVSYENGEDVGNRTEREQNLAVEALAVLPLDSSFLQDCSLLNASLEGCEVAEIPTRSSLVTTSEIEIDNGHQNIHGPKMDDVSTNSMIDRDEFQEPSAPPPSDTDLAAAIPEPNSSDHAHGILEESAAMVLEDRGVSQGRSLTLDEATDAILFCNSIVHDLAYRAAAIAIDKEDSILVEVSRPTVTVVGKTSSDRKDLRVRTGGKRSLRSQKPRRKRMEMDTQTYCSEPENDENAPESLTRNVGIPNKVDSTKPPKLESKCNCTVM